MPNVNLLEALFGRGLDDELFSYLLNIPKVGFLILAKFRMFGFGLF